MSRFASLLTFCLVTATGSVLPAQSVRELAPGQRVRIGAPGVRPEGAEATVIAWQDDTLLLRPAQSGGDSIARIPLSAIEWLEVGQRRSRGAGALRGLGIGFLSGALLGGAVGLLDENTDFGRLGNAALGAAVFGAAGAVIGPLFGAISPGYRWTNVELPARVGIVPLGRGSTGLLVSFRMR